MFRPAMRSFALFAVFTSLVLFTAPVQAVADRPTCTGSESPHDFATANYTTAAKDVEGMRAIIRLRTDGTLCTATGGNYDGFVTSYTAVDNTDDSLISQIGWYQYFDPATSQRDICRFFAFGFGSPHFYRCNKDTDDKDVHFEVEFDGTANGSIYQMIDCGVYAFDGPNCTVQGVSSGTYKSSYGFVGTEDNYTSCVVHFTGSSSDNNYFGTEDTPMNGENGNGVWGVRNLSPSPANCSHYKLQVSNTVVGTWDDRNAS